MSINISNEDVLIVLAGQKHTKEYFYAQKRIAIANNEEPPIINTLYPWQEEILEQKAKEWIDIGLSCEPADRAEAERCIKLIYEKADLKEPQFMWARSPAEAQKMANEVCDTENIFYDNLMYGCHDYYWSHYDAILAIGCDIEQDIIDEMNVFISLAKSCYWWLAFDGLVIVSDRPETVTDSKSIFRDGFEVNLKE